MFRKVESSGGVNPPTHMGKDQHFCRLQIISNKVTPEQLIKSQRTRNSLLSAVAIIIAIAMYLASKKYCSNDEGLLGPSRKKPLSEAGEYVSVKEEHQQSHHLPVVYKGTDNMILPLNHYMFSLRK